MTVSASTRVNQFDPAIALSDTDLLYGFQTNEVKMTVAQVRTALLGNATREIFTAGPLFTASISGNTLTVSAIASGTLAVGQTVFGTGVAAARTITALGTGTGGVGTYTLSGSAQTITSEAMGAASASQFAPGFSTSITLAGTYGSINNILVLFDAAPQTDDTLAGQVLGFNPVVPAGTQQIVVIGWPSRSIGVPADASVTAVKLAPNAVTAPSIATGAVSAKLATEAVSQVGTGQFWTQNGALIQRFNDRVFIGGATQSDAAFPPVNLDWFTAYQMTLGYSNQPLFGALCVETSPSSAAQEMCAGEFAAQSLTAQSAGPACIALEAFAINNNASFANSAWTFYGEAHRASAAAGAVYGMELDTHTLYPSIAPNPYQQGNVVGLQLASGAGVQGVQLTASISGTTLNVTSATPELAADAIAVGQTIFGVGVTAGTKITALGTGAGGVGTYTVNNSQTVSSRYMVSTIQADSSAAIQIENNPTKWYTGISFGATSLVGCDGVSGTATAIALAKGHQITWYNQGAAASCSISSGVSNPSNGTGIQFTDTGLQINATSGPALAYFPAVANAVNYFLFDAATTGNSPNIVAGGSDANIDLGLVTQGTGVVKFGTYTASTFSQTGYISIKDAGGTVRRLMVG